MSVRGRGFGPRPTELNATNRRTSGVWGDSSIGSGEINAVHVRYANIQDGESDSGMRGFVPKEVQGSGGTLPSTLALPAGQGALERRYRFVGLSPTIRTDMPDNVAGRVPAVDWLRRRFPVLP